MVKVAHHFFITICAARYCGGMEIIMQINEIENIMKAYAEASINFGKVFGIMLDYSEESIEAVEEILNNYRKSLPRNMLGRYKKKLEKDEKTIQIAEILGGYIGEVIRKYIGGEWFIEDDIVTLVINDTKIFPSVKVFKRIKNGSEDSVYFYYKTLKNGLNDIISCEN